MSSRPRRMVCTPALSWMRLTVFAGLVLLAAACMDSSGPTSSTSAQGVHGAYPPPNPPAPVINGPSVLYSRDSPSTYGQDAYLMSLGADSAFVIEFPNSPTSWAWAGRYERRDSVIVFHYNAWSAAGALGATGIVRGDTMFLKYNFIMQMTDFEDGVYVRAR